MIQLDIHCKVYKIYIYRGPLPSFGKITIICATNELLQLISKAS